MARQAFGLSASAIDPSPVLLKDVVH